MLPARPAHHSLPQIFGFRGIICHGKCAAFKLRAIFEAESSSVQVTADAASVVEWQKKLPASLYKLAQHRRVLLPFFLPTTALAVLLATPPPLLSL